VWESRCGRVILVLLQQADDGERQLAWYNAGHRIALDIARGLHFLHSLEVRLLPFCGEFSRHAFIAS